MPLPGLKHPTGILELEGQLELDDDGGSEDATKILNSDSTCPLCQQILSKSNMNVVDMKTKDEWVNMVMAGVHPQSIMKSAYKGVTFWIGQKDVETQATIHKAMQMRKRFEEVEAKCVQRVEQIHEAYKKAMKRVHQLEQENESMKKDQVELQEKYSEKSRQKRKLEEMYEALRTQYEKVKRSNPAPTPNEVSRFNLSTPGIQAGLSHLAPNRHPIQTPDMWSPCSDNDNAPGYFDLHRAPSPVNRVSIRPAPAVSPFKRQSIFNTVGGNPVDTLRNLLMSPMTRQPARASGTSGLK